MRLGRQSRSEDAKRKGVALEAFAHVTTILFHAVHAAAPEQRRALVAGESVQVEATQSLAEIRTQIGEGEAAG
jgi:hypothetical protein